MITADHSIEEDALKEVEKYPKKYSAKRFCSIIFSVKNNLELRPYYEVSGNLPQQIKEERKKVFWFAPCLKML